MEILLFPLLVVAQAIPTVLAVVVGIAIARWMGLFEPRHHADEGATRRRGLGLAVGVVAIALVLVLLLAGVSSDGGGNLIRR